MARIVGCASLTPSADASTLGPVTSRRVVIVAFEGMQVLDVAGPHEVFAGVGRILPDGRGYDVDVVATAEGPVRSESGLGVTATRIDPSADVDTLLVPGGSGVLAAIEDPE